MKKMLLAGMAAGLVSAASAAELVSVGNWKVDFDEATGVLRLDNAARRVSLDGKVGFVSKGALWRVVAPRDAAMGRLSLVNPGGTVLGYVSFRGEGDRLTLETFHRAGANFFSGIFSYDATARVRETSFACRTIPSVGEQVLNFADGTGDSGVNDSVFAREEDLALRLFSVGTRVVSKGGGLYGVHVEANIDEPSAASFTIFADGAYFKSRWVPRYRPLDRARCPKAPTGWMSWNTYFDKAGSAENLAEARVGAKYLKPFGLDIWSIESWQDNSLWLPVGDFHNLDLSCYAKQFPEGMKWLADEIRKLGFRPGLWMPLYGTGDKAFHDAHRDLFLHDATGKPIDCWNGRYMLDTTNEKALDLMRSLCRTAANDWGYEFFKFDGMANTPRKFERPEIRACAKDPKDTAWFDRSVRALREGIGEKSLMLGCMGDFTGTEAQYLDATRLGSDVVGCYRGIAETYHPDGANSVAQMPVKWKNVLHQAECTFTQIFLNNLMFFTDPDTLLVGYALETHEAEVMATIVGLPGQLMFAGDRLAVLKYDRMKMIQQILPVADVHPQNLYPYSASAMLPIWNLSVTRPFGTWHVVALFNFTDEPKAFSVPVAELGLESGVTYTAFEFWSQQRACDFADALVAEKIPMRSVKLYAIRQAADRPQFLGDDRHITQGAIELTDEKWDEKTNTLTLGVRAIAGFPFAYHASLPEGYSFKSVAADGAKVTAKVKDGFVALTVASDTSRDVVVTASFAKKITK